uniref:Glycosyl hydrolase family 32 N-terminal domain-containing protein n=1 Tax=Physcomitrium patens TaxID=3218 RepID=A0A2K1JMW2_PHYPA|nr:hypothetical protein PHYPA_017719 [Physcomitrium patens]
MLYLLYQHQIGRFTGRQPRLATIKYREANYNKKDLSSVYPSKVQARGDPEDPSDPLPRKWVKAPYNPIAPIPLGYNSSQFRDPTEAWRLFDGVWGLLVGANAGEGGLIGTALLYKSMDFQTWSFSNRLHEDPTTGMWECPDLFPVRIKGRKDLNTSAVGKGVLHVLKVSLELKTKHDYYSVGNYLAEANTYKPLIVEINTSIELSRCRSKCESAFMT